MILSHAVRSLVVFAALVALASPARADDSVEVERGKNSYDGGQYQEGADRFRVMLDPVAPTALKDPAAIERARGYYAACLVALGRLAEADREIERILRQNPLYAPDPVIFPSKVIDRFTDVKARYKVEIEAALRAKAEADRAERERMERTRREQIAYVAELQKLASEEVVVVRHSRWVAAVPFGAGQFQNGQPVLGFTLLVAESLAAGASVVAGAIWPHLAVQYRPGEVDTRAFNDQLNTLQQVSLYSGAAFAGLAIAGIVEAQFSFVPEVREVKGRPLPKPPRLLPAASAIPGGAVFGAFGTF